MAGDFSVVIYGKKKTNNQTQQQLTAESSRQESATKPRRTQTPKQKLWFFIMFLTKGLWGWSWEGGGGRAFHDLYSTYRHFWRILYKCSAGVSSTSTGMIYAFITPNPASRSFPFTHHFSMQASQVNFLSFYSSHRKLTHLCGFLVLCWFTYSYIWEICGFFFFSVSLPLLLNM